MVNNVLITAIIRVAIGFVFMHSFVNKVRNIPDFRNTITKFAVFPSSYSNFLAYSFLAGEVTASVSTLIGGPFLILGFALAAALFLVFSIGLSSVLVRKIETPCGCFGSDEKQVSVSHVVRSTGFMLCSMLGLYFSLVGGISQFTYSIFEWFSISVMAIVFDVTLVNSGEIVKLLTRK